MEDRNNGTVYLSYVRTKLISTNLHEAKILQNEGVIMFFFSSDKQILSKLMTSRPSMKDILG